MFNKFTNSKLGIIFAVLVVIFGVMLLWNGKDDRTFREVLVDIDTAAVTEIMMYPKSQNHDEVKLYKENDDWYVKLSEEKSAFVPAQKITGLFAQLLAIVPKRLAARDQSKWNEFQVDSTATRVKVVEEGDITLDLIIGRFSYQQQPRSMSTFVRLANDVDIYEVDGFLEMSFNQGANTFRDGSIINSDFESWKQLSFDYPADSSFQMIKVENGWIANFVNSDSTKAVRYLRQLGNISGNSFFDDITPDQLPAPTYKLTVENESGELVEIMGYEMGERFIITSSANRETYFDGLQNKLKEKIFIGLNSILP